MITKDRALEILANLDTIAFPALDGPSLYYKELERYVLGEDDLSVGQECTDDLVAKLAETRFGLFSVHKVVPEEGTLLHKVKDLDWPEGAVCVVQDRNGATKWLPSMPCGSWCRGYGGSSTSPDREGEWWFVDSVGDIVCSGEYAIDYLYSVPLSQDWETSIITKEMWEAVQ